MFKDYSVISKTYMTSFFCLLLLSTSNVRMSEGTFCHVEVHIKVGFKGVYISQTCFPDVRTGCITCLPLSRPSSLPHQIQMNDL